MSRFSKLQTLSVILLWVACSANSQNFFISTDFEGTRQARQFFPSRPGQASSSASSGGGSASASASAGGGATRPTSISPELQQQFADIFDWNKDLANDTRFTTCDIPDIGEVERACPKRAFFYGLNPQHRQAVGMVKQILTRPQNAQQTVCLAGAMRDLPGMNPNVWVRGLLGAHLSDVGLFDLEVPPIVEVVPHTFINREYLQEARRQSLLDPTSRRCVMVDGSVGADNGVENGLWYFREDVQVNSFHLNWHLIYPFTGAPRKADRQGELFYFTHHNHMARYHAERLSNGLRRVVPLDIQPNAVVPEGFNPHLTDLNSGMNWTARAPNRRVSDTVFVNITGVPPRIEVSERVLHVQRVVEAINDRALRLRNGQGMPLNNIQGIDILGDVVEASTWTPNGDYYGNFGFHNEGHVILALIEDPRNQSSLPPGVMVEVATAMRDPIFYTYHTAMDDVFDLHKQRLPPYEPESGDLPLKWEGIEIESVEAIPERGIPNKLTTFFNQRTFELTRGLDFNRSGVQGVVSACVQHLDHNPFAYKIYVNRAPYATTGRATVRIFLAPRYDESGRRYTMTEQRKLFFMMDLFTVQLRPGLNRITRRSSDSALTIDILQSLPTAQQSKFDRNREKPRTYCGCGWPHHMLLPRGNEKGMTFDLFVMLTNGDQDYVRPRNPPRQPGECKPAPIYCGRLNDTYPDGRPMGYPFDRLPYSASGHYWEQSRPVESLEEYVYGIPNMAATQVTIQHIGRGSSQQQGGGQVQFEDDRRSQPGRGRPFRGQGSRPGGGSGGGAGGPIKFNNFEGASDVEVQEIPLIHHSILTSALQQNPQEQLNFDTGSSNYYNYKNFRQWLQPFIAEDGHQQGFASEAYFVGKDSSYGYRA